jgi:hypothetical protein
VVKKDGRSNIKNRSIVVTPRGFLKFSFVKEREEVVNIKIINLMKNLKNFTNFVLRNLSENFRFENEEIEDMFID